MCTAKWIEHECGQQLSVKDYALQMQRCRGRVCWGGPARSRSSPTRLWRAVNCGGNWATPTSQRCCG